MEPLGVVRVLIFQLGSLQVFTNQTQEQHQSNAPYTEVYWMDIVGSNVYGPFPNVYETMKHYTWTIDNQKSSPETQKGQVIYVNFTTKKRVVYA